MRFVPTVDILTKILDSGECLYYIFYTNDIQKCDFYKEYDPYSVPHGYLIRKSFSTGAVEGSIEIMLKEGFFPIIYYGTGTDGQFFSSKFSLDKVEKKTVLNLKTTFFNNIQWINPDEIDEDFADYSDFIIENSSAADILKKRFSTGCAIKTGDVYNHDFFVYPEENAQIYKISTILTCFNGNETLILSDQSAYYASGNLNFEQPVENILHVPVLTKLEPINFFNTEKKKHKKEKKALPVTIQKKIDDITADIPTITESTQIPFLPVEKDVIISERPLPRTTVLQNRK
jgi:hypothetical protein